MKPLRDLSIRTKLFGVIALSCSTALLMAILSVLTFEWFTSTERQVNAVQTQASIIGEISEAALIFNDSKSATEYLSALNVRPQVLAAALYDHRGRLFAQFERNPYKHHFEKPRHTSYVIENDAIHLFREIYSKTELIGTVYIYEDLQRIDRMRNYVMIILLVGISSLILALWASQVLQNKVSRPIIEIAQLTNDIIINQDYSLRLEKGNGDELGQLSFALNELFAHIEDRDVRLLNINQALVNEVQERYRIQNDLDRNLLELARSNRELEQFAYVSSHDLQEPLRMIASYTQLIERRYKSKLDEQGELFLHYILDGAKHMQILINDLLSLSRVGRTDSEETAVDLNLALRQALLNLHLSIVEHKVIIKAQTLPIVVGNLIQFTQLFQNLVSNAIKFRGNRETEIEIFAEKLNSDWKVAVKDNGIGIDQAHYDRVFIVFQRLHGRGDYPGSGIGLAICKKIVERFGGQLWLESIVGQGSTFYFTLRDPKCPS